MHDIKCNIFGTEQSFIEENEEIGKRAMKAR